MVREDDLSSGAETALEISTMTPFSSNSTRKNSILFYVATVQAYIITYRTEVLLGCVLATSIVAISTSFGGTKYKRENVNPFEAAIIGHDYSSIQSKYDLTLGYIDHWCLRGDDNSCKCDDPLEPISRRSHPRWELQHKENVKSAEVALMLSLSNGHGGFYGPNYDDEWIEGGDDDWVFGEGSRFDTDHDYGNRHPIMDYTDEGGWDDRDDDGYAVPLPTEEGNIGGVPDGSKRLRESVAIEDMLYKLDVVFVGDSITEQRQGTSMSKPNDNYIGIKEVFDKTFTRDKGGDFNGLAMGISADTSPNLLWRLMNGEMPNGLNPSVWWVGIGINDLSIKGCSEDVTLLGILRVVEEIQNKHPEGVVVINSILPVQRNQDGLLEHIGKHNKDVALKMKEQDMLAAQMDKKRDRYDFWPSIVSINKELAKFASKHKMIHFFNADKIFVDDRKDGKYMRLDLFNDPVHPNLAGHKKLNTEIKKVLREIIMDKS